MEVGILKLCITKTIFVENTTIYIRQQQGLQTVQSNIILLSGAQLEIVSALSANLYICKSDEYGIQNIRLAHDSTNTKLLRLPVYSGMRNRCIREGSSLRTRSGDTCVVVSIEKSNGNRFICRDNKVVMWDAVTSFCSVPIAASQPNLNNQPPQQNNTNQQNYRLPWTNIHHIFRAFPNNRCW
jgi:hypothetical protein